jgi:hypothetical protein
MVRHTVRAFTCLIVSSFATHQLLGQQVAATHLVHQAIEAQGGEAVLRSLKSMQWTLVGYRNMLEQSERPEGPYLPEFDQRTEVHDYQNARYMDVTEAKVFPAFAFTQSSVVAAGVSMRIANGQKLPGPPEQVALAHERMALSPERLLLSALEAADLHQEADCTLQSVNQNVLVFTFDDAPVRVFLNAYTHLPTAVDYSGPLARSGYWRFLGDVTTRTFYSSWWLGKDGIHLPMQWNVESNGLPDQTYFVQKVQTNGVLNEETLKVPGVIAAQSKLRTKSTSLDDLPLGSSSGPAVELSPGVVLIPGAWNVTLVRQDDGIVILEAPISSGYSAKVIADAHRRFPGQPIKAVVTTSDSWPHLAGVREYVAAGIPIYGLDINQRILKRVIDSPYTHRPDTLQRSRKVPEFHLVSVKSVLPSRTNPLEIYPIRGETSERQMMVYFPQQQMLYGSDPFQQGPSGTYYFPQTITELTDAVRREHLLVARFFMMHIPLTPWASLQIAVDAAKAEDSPNGTLQ